MLIWELKTIDKDNLHDLATYFSENHSIEEILKSYNVIEDTGYGLLGLEAKLDDSIRFDIHKRLSCSKEFYGITFSKQTINTLSIAELIDLYPIYHRGYIAYDDEYGYAFRSVSKNYMIEAYVKGNYNEETDLHLSNLLRLRIVWDIDNKAAQ